MKSEGELKLGDSVTHIKGVGKKRAQLLEKMNIRTVEDLLYLSRENMKTDDVP